MIKKLIVLIFVVQAALLHSKEVSWVVGKLDKVIDGDTAIFVVANNITIKIRMACIDTPESLMSKKVIKQMEKCNCTFRDIKFLGNKSKEYAISHLSTGNSYLLKITGKGYFGRYIGYIYYLDNFSCFNYNIVKDGFAFSSGCKETNKLEKEAKVLKKGLWKSELMQCLDNKKR